MLVQKYYGRNVVTTVSQLLTTEFSVFENNFASPNKPADVNTCIYVNSIYTI